MTRPATLPPVERLRNAFNYCPDTGIFHRRASGGLVPLGISYDRRGYVRVSVFSHPYAAHRLAWYYTREEWPDLQVDHINGIKDDNRFANLRLATPSQNNANKPLTSANSSGVKGVSWNIRKGKWQVFIRCNGRNKNLGYFCDIDEARVAYKVASKLIHGDFANTGEVPL